MIVELSSGRFWAVHTPTTTYRPPAGAYFDTHLGAKCWMLVKDDRHGTRGWPYNIDVLYSPYNGAEPIIDAQRRELAA